MRSKAEWSAHCSKPSLIVVWESNLHLVVLVRIISLPRVTRFSLVGAGSPDDGVRGVKRLNLSTTLR